MFPFVFKTEFHSFADIDFNEKFFDSFRSDYPDFDDWAKRKAKAGEMAALALSGGRTNGFLYLKPERGGALDIRPPIGIPVLKIGSFKASGRVMGHLFLNMAFEEMVSERLCGIYATFWPRHRKLAAFLSGRGFVKHGVKGFEEAWLHERREIMNFLGCFSFRRAAAFAF